MKSPCYNCPDRELGCHDRCNKYIEFHDQQLRVRENRRHKDIDDFKVNVVMKKRLDRFK